MKQASQPGNEYGAGVIQYEAVRRQSFFVDRSLSDSREALARLIGYSRRRIGRAASAVVRVRDIRRDELHEPDAALGNGDHRAGLLSARNAPQRA